MYEMKFFSPTSWLNRVSLKKTHLSGKQNVQTIQQIPKSFDTLRGLKFELCLSLTQIEKNIKLYLFSLLMMQCLFLSSSFRHVQCLQRMLRNLPTGCCIMRFFQKSLWSSFTSMGEMSKRRQLNKTEWYGVVQDLNFYDTRWILKFSLKHCLMNEFEIF